MTLRRYYRCEHPVETCLFLARCFVIVMTIDQLDLEIAQAQRASGPNNFYEVRGLRNAQAIVALLRDSVVTTV